MRFLYKIHSNYDGFTPTQIPNRLHEGKYLPLGWNRYLDSLSVGDECWIYFYGRHAFTPGVYVKGYIKDIDTDGQVANLRVREYSTNTPLMDEETNQQIAEVVSVRYRQVFRWPAEWNVIPQCNVTACGQRLCDNCNTWNDFPIIDAAHLRGRPYTRAQVTVPAFWIIPSRCYIYREGKHLAPWVERLTHMFEEFKLGERRYAYPFAKGIYEALRRRHILEFDAIIPIPLSPDKIGAGELHRTKVLAAELGRLLGVRVREYLTLAEPLSKRRFLAAGNTKSAFEQRYRDLLVVDERVRNLRSVLLVDDVITRGSTTTCATSGLLAENNDLSIVIASAGQMILKETVASEQFFVQ